MAQPSPLSVLSGALKIADKFTITLEAVGNKIRANSQGWEDARVLTERQVAMVVAIKGVLSTYCPNTGRRSSRISTRRDCTRRVMGPTISNERSSVTV